MPVPLTSQATRPILIKIMDLHKSDRVQCLGRSRLMHRGRSTTIASQRRKGTKFYRICSKASQSFREERSEHEGTKCLKQHLARRLTQTGTFLERQGSGRRTYCSVSSVPVSMSSFVNCTATSHFQYSQKNIVHAKWGARARNGPRCPPGTEGMIKSRPSQSKRGSPLDAGLTSA